MVGDRRGPLAAHTHMVVRMSPRFARASTGSTSCILNMSSEGPSLRDLTKMCGRVALCAGRPAAPTSGTVGCHKKNTDARAGAAALGES
jgi:hypothetical protein